MSPFQTISRVFIIHEKISIFQFWNSKIVQQKISGFHILRQNILSFNYYRQETNPANSVCQKISIFGMKNSVLIMHNIKSIWFPFSKPEYILVSIYI